jgi:hypothetical protein
MRDEEETAKLEDPAHRHTLPTPWPSAASRSFIVPDPADSDPAYMVGLP